MTAFGMYVPEEQIRICTPGISQEVTQRNLGFGNLYYALVKMLEPAHVLVIGSGFGFSVATMATALAQIGRGRLTFVDPSMDMIKSGLQTSGSGQWDTPEQVLARFSCAGIPQGIITHYRETNAQFFAQYEARKLPSINIAMIDGAHDSYNVSFDLINVVARLHLPGYVLLHDVTDFANRIGYMGVADIVRAVRKQAGVEEITFPGSGGLTLLRITSSPTIEIQRLPRRGILLPILGGVIICGLIGYWLGSCLRH